MFTDAAADRGIWWLNPLAFVAAFCLVPFLLVFVDIAQSSGDSFTMRSHLYLDQSSLLLGLPFFAAFMLGAAYFIPSQAHPPRIDPTGVTWGIRDGFLDFLALSTLAAYLIWFRPLVTDPMRVPQIQPSPASRR
jgi:amino acid permease